MKKYSGRFLYMTGTTAYVDINITAERFTILNGCTIFYNGDDYTQNIAMIVPTNQLIITSVTVVKETPSNTGSTPRKIDNNEQPLN